MKLSPRGQYALHAMIFLAKHRMDGPQPLKTIAEDGLPEQYLERAFDLGVRFDPVKPGTGLGLAIARDLASTMGLQLELANRNPGCAAIVRFAGEAASPG